jgi:hypothetical protein
MAKYGGQTWTWNDRIRTGATIMNILRPLSGYA